MDERPLTDVPSREGVAALTHAVQAIVPPAMLGIARVRDDGRVSVFYSNMHAIGAHLVDAPDVPDFFRPPTSGPRVVGADVINAHPTRPIEYQLQFLKIQQAISVPIRGLEFPALLWVALHDPTPLTARQLSALEGVAGRVTGMLGNGNAHETEFELLRRLEMTAELLPALRNVLDVREVFDRLSTISRKALPHDTLAVGLFSDDLTEVTLHAHSGPGRGPVGVSPNRYPPTAARAWDFQLLHDITTHPYEKESAFAKQGMRSSLRLPIWVDNQLIASINFMLAERAAYTNVDVLVAKRIADHVALALSHHRLAEAARRAEELRARATSIDLLEALLSALIDSGEIRDAFGKICDIAQKVLAHDSAALMVRLADGTHARLYASSGFPMELPEITEIPEEILRNEEWDYDILDDLAQQPQPRYARLAEIGFRSALRVPIRFEGKFAGALVFLAKQVAGFKPADVPVARRMADRLAVSLARDREIQALRRADEADARASRLEARVRALTEELDARTGYRRVIGESVPWRQVLTLATQVAATGTNVLLLGESGTGKEVVARFIHRASARKDGPFVAVNCAALPEHLLEAELFGYERGAFTGAVQSKPGQLEQASGGTLLLDEVGEMSLAAQAKFLRVLQEREFQRLGGTRVLRSDARIVAATNRDLHRAVGQGTFREDLFYRLNVFAIQLPALRDRKEDILPLSEAFLAEIGRGIGHPPAGVSRDARQRLVEHDWPGNVRELRNTLERAAILCDGGLITGEHLAFPAPRRPAEAPRISPAAQPQADELPATAAPAATDLPSMERARIEQALRNARFNKSKAAKELGLTRTQLYVRMRRHGLS